MSRNEKIAAYLGFSVKSGKIVYGYERVILGKKKVYLILCDVNLSGNSLKKVEEYAESSGVKCLSVEGLSDYFGEKRIKCVGLAEEHLASATEKELLRSEVVTDE